MKKSIALALALVCTAAAAQAEELFGGRLRKRKIKHVKPIADARY